MYSADGHLFILEIKNVCTADINYSAGVDNGCGFQRIAGIDDYVAGFEREVLRQARDSVYGMAREISKS